jgi:PAS domain S-box-containing protein
MVELSLNAIVLVNSRGEIVSINSQTEKMFGYSRDQLVGQLVEVLVPERFKRDHPKSRSAFFSNPIVRPMGAGRDLFGRRSDGSEFPVEIGLSPIETVDGPAVLGSIVDITERKRLEERFRFAVESAPNAMVMINGLGRIELVNLQTERLFGYSREELLGQSVEILVPDRFRARHPEYRKAFCANPVVRAMGAGRDLYGRRKDGTEFPVEIGLNPIETDVETLVLSAIVDITARKESEERVRKHSADLAHVARLSTVGQMLSELAHEINQPLAAAANFARACATFARSSRASRRQMIEWMEKTVDQTTRAIEIVNRLGSFVKKNDVARTLVDINRLVEQVVTSSIPAVRTPSSDGTSVRLELKLDDSMPSIYADRVQIEQVLLNLVRNAVEAMQDPSVAARILTLQTTHDELHVHVAVGDTGPGINPDHLGRLFEPYFTTKASGIGLGLSISRSIVEDHNGRFDVQSSERGTTFRFTLPNARRN